MKKNLILFWQLCRLNIKQSLIYRINFLITLFSMGLWIGIYVLFFEVLFLHIDNLAGWNKAEILLFLTFYYFIQSIGNIFYRESFEMFGQELRYGILDHAITKPTSTQLLLFFKQIRFDHLIDFIITIALFLYIATYTQINFTATLLFFGLFIALFGNFLFYGLLLGISSIVFYVDKLDGVASLLWHASQISRYPRQIFKGVGKIIFEFILPIGILASIPAEIALNQSSNLLILYYLSSSLIFFLIGTFIFNMGLKKYSSSN